MDDLRSVNSSVKYQADVALKEYYGSLVTLDPILVLAVISTIISLIRFVKECRAGDEKAAIEAIRNPSIWQRWQFKRILKKACKGYNVDTSEVYSVLFSRKDRISEAEFTTLYWSIS